MVSVSTVGEDEESIFGVDLCNFPILFMDVTNVVMMVCNPTASSTANIICRLIENRAVRVTEVVVCSFVDSLLLLVFLVVPNKLFPWTFIIIDIVHCHVSYTYIIITLENVVGVMVVV
jgi:hypothetical protein